MAAVTYMKAWNSSREKGSEFLESINVSANFLVFQGCTNLTQTASSFEDALFRNIFLIGAIVLDDPGVIDYDQLRERLVEIAQNEGYKYAGEILCHLVIKLLEIPNRMKFLQRFHSVKEISQAEIFFFSCNSEFRVG